MATVQDIIEAVETIAPPFLALDWDRPRIGLHCGAPEAPAKRVAVALDASLAAIAAAEKMKADMLLVHHPRFWTQIKNLVQSDPSGNRGLAMVKAGLAVYSAHTNLDIAPGGTNDCLAELAGIAPSEILEPSFKEKLIKLAVFTPADHADKMIKALDKAGAGAIGNYSGCTFRSRGAGTFRCGPDTNPFQGKPGSWEEADEYRIETIFGELSRDAVVAAMLSAHPYEEPAYDLYSIIGTGKIFGLGRIGHLPSPESVESLAKRLAKAAHSAETQYSGKGTRKVSRIAVWAGAGAPLELMLANGAEAVITGELGYHDIETFTDYGIAAITLGHGRSEEPALPRLIARLKKRVKGVEFVLAGKGQISVTNV